LSEEKYRSIFENAIEGMFQNTPDGRFLTVNPAIAKMHGYSSPEELMGSVTDIATQLYADPADRERFKAILEKNGYIEGFETRFKRKDGGWAWFSINAKAVRGIDGQTIYYEGTVEDITERKRKEDALKASEERYRTFIDSASEGVFLKDSESRYLIVNKQLCTFIGRKEKDIIGSSDNLLLPPGIAKRSKEADLKTINTGSIMVYEETLGARVYEIRKFPVNLKDDSKGIGGFIRDITESKRMEEDLRAKSLSLEEVNAALRVLLAQREQDKKDMEEKIINNIKILVLPYIERIGAKRIDQETKTYLEILETNLQNIISPFLKRMMLAYAQFTPTEIHVANLIRQGMGIKEIARTLGVSQNAINHHRQSIRNKLGLNQMKVNLKTHLMRLS
jgi:PAS domain S-box-containing protein